MASNGEYKDTQSSFAGGRFSKELHGRVDLAKFRSGFKDSKNFFVSPEGVLLNRAGTETIDRTGNTIDETQSSRIIPFVFSDTECLLFVLSGNTVFGQGTLEIFKYDYTTDEVTRLNATVNFWWFVDPEDEDNDEMDWVGNKTLWPWTASDAQTIRYSQSGDVITFTYPDASSTKRPLKLSRVSSDSTLWRFEYLDFTVPVFPTFGGIPRLLAELEGNEAAGHGDLPTADDDHPALPWQWAVSRVMQTADGDVYETYPFVINDVVHYRVTKYRAGQRYGGAGDPYSYVWVDTSGVESGPYDAVFNANWYGAFDGAVVDRHPMPGDAGGAFNWTQLAGSVLDPIIKLEAVPELVVCYADKPITIDWMTFTQRPETVDDTEDRVIATRIYKGRDGHFGFIGEVDGEAMRFIDTGLEPDFLTPPRTTNHHFKIPGRGLEGASDYVAEIVEYPSVLGTYEGRRLLASTLLRPTLVAGSAVEMYDNFDNINPAKDADPFAFELPSHVWEKIRFFVPRHGLYVFTSEGVWIAAGSGQLELLTPNSIAARQISNIGTGSMRPLIVNDVVMFVENTGTTPNAMFLKGMETQAVDLSGVSREFFRTRTIVDWAWAETPWLNLWVAMSDGKLLSCAWSPEQQLVAWAEHEIQDGLVKSVASIPAYRETAVFVLVQRGTKYYLERMARRQITDIRDARFADAHVWYDGRNITTTNAASVISIAGNRGVNYDVDVTVSEATAGLYLDQVLRVWGTNSDGDDIFVDVRLDTSGGLGVYTGLLLTPLPEDLDGVSTDDYEICRSTINGLDHLDGETVVALCDGRVITGLVVAGGAVVLGSQPMVYGGTVCVGLAYDSDFESLRMVPEKGRQRVVKAVMLETYGSRGGYVGQSFDEADLEEVVVREVEHNYQQVPLKNEEISVPILASYDTKGEVVYRQTAPLPVMISAIVRETEFGG